MDEEFTSRWRKKEHDCGFESIASVFVVCDTCMLPRDAAPFLTLDLADCPQPICHVFGSPADWSDADRARLASYRVIGFDGTGNPVCIEQDSPNVWLLDHEDRFRSRQFINGSVHQFAECLLAYMGENEPERFRQAVQVIDGQALADGAFWWYEAKGLETP